MWTFIRGRTSEDDSINVYNEKFEENPTSTVGARKYGGTFVYNDELYLVGGYGSGDSKSFTRGNKDDVWKYNTERDVWVWIAGDTRVNINYTQIPIQGMNSPIKPSARNSFMVAYDNNTVYFYGGKFSTSYENDLGYFSDLWTLTVTDLYIPNSGNTTDSSSEVINTEIKSETSNKIIVTVIIAISVSLFVVIVFVVLVYFLVYKKLKRKSYVF